MRKHLLIILLLLTRLAWAQEPVEVFPSPFTAPDSGVLLPLDYRLHLYSTKDLMSAINWRTLMDSGKADKKIMGFSQNYLPIEFYFFPGTSKKNALVIGGVHGSELSAIEVAKQLINQLQKGEKPFYNVVIVPTLFPDNAVVAEAYGRSRDATSTGRFTSDAQVDPNRQMPQLGKAFDSRYPMDAYERPIEAENVLLLRLIQTYLPSRIVNLHAIKDFPKAGVYADPRTDCHGLALGFASDSTLALLMAESIAKQGGNVPGNSLKNLPTALYYLDPMPVAAGQHQPRNLYGASMNGKIRGISLGSWASTAVCDEATGNYRPAIRIITMEFPGYWKPTEYLSKIDHAWYAQQTVLYAGAIRDYFLQDYFSEDGPVEPKATASN